MKDNKLFNEVRQLLRTHALISGGFVFIFWMLEIVDRLVFHGGLDAFGIRPRTLAGLWGILFAPFLHVGFGHLLANTLPFLVLGWFVMLRRMSDFFLVTAITALVSGLGIWLFGPSRSVHLGASGLIFGYFGFLLLRGYFERSLTSILWSILVVILYGGMVWGVLPRGIGISWQSHLFGFIGGGLASYLTSRPRETVLKVEV